MIAQDEAASFRDDFAMISGYRRMLRTVENQDAIGMPAKGERLRTQHMIMAIELQSHRSRIHRHGGRQRRNVHGTTWQLLPMHPRGDLVGGPNRRVGRQN